MKLSLEGLEMSMEIDFRRLKVHTNSQLVTCQVSGEYEARDNRIMAYQVVIRILLQNFEQVYVELILRISNAQADALPNWQSRRDPQK